MPENISGVPAGRSVFHLTSPLIGLLAGNNFRIARLAQECIRIDPPLYLSVSDSAILRH